MNMVSSCVIKPTFAQEDPLLLDWVSPCRGLSLRRGRLKLRTSKSGPHKENGLNGFVKDDDDSIQSTQKLFTEERSFDSHNDLITSKLPSLMNSEAMLKSCKSSNQLLKLYMKHNDDVKVCNLKLQATSSKSTTMNKQQSRVHLDKKTNVINTLIKPKKKRGKLRCDTLKKEINESNNSHIINTERRRLSLSQCDLAGEDTTANEVRGFCSISTNTNYTISAHNDNHNDSNKAVLPSLTNNNSNLQQDPHQLIEKNISQSTDCITLDCEQQHPLDMTIQEEEKERNSVGKKQKKHPRRLSITGAPSTIRQDHFENKCHVVKAYDGKIMDDSSMMFTHLGIGFACKKGLKPESPNQDDFFIMTETEWALYGVFDGHGPYGHNVSNFVQRELLRILLNDHKLFFTETKQVFKNAFHTVHHLLEACGKTQPTLDCTLSGTTATVVLHRKDINKLYVAHVGDSRCILGRISPENGGRVCAIDLTNDHKPNNIPEMKRIHASGGEVKQLDGDVPHRVFLKNKLYPGLAMSRAIGDSLGRRAGVISEPDVAEYSLNLKEDLFIALCSDGVWEFFDSNEVAEMIFCYGNIGVQSAANRLAKESWNRWIQEEGTVVDDITAEINEVLVYL